MVLARKLEPDEDAARYSVVLEPAEYAMLRALPARLERLLCDPSSAPRVMDRLFPPAHMNDAAAEAEYRRLMGDALIERRRSSIDAFLESLGSRPSARSDVRIDLDARALDVWLHVINDLRMLLATGLDIQDNEWSLGGPRSPDDLPDFTLLLHLSDLQQTLIDAL